MEEPTERRAAVTGKYPKRLPAYGSVEDLALAHRVAEKRRMSVAALIRVLIHEEAGRQGVE
jgi:hypothetical protein